MASATADGPAVSLLQFQRLAGALDADVLLVGALLFLAQDLALGLAAPRAAVLELRVVDEDQVGGVS